MKPDRNAGATSMPGESTLLTSGAELQALLGMVGERLATFVDGLDTAPAARCPRMIGAAPENLDATLLLLMPE